MPQKAWSAKRERQYALIKNSRRKGSVFIAKEAIEYIANQIALAISVSLDMVFMFRAVPVWAAGILSLLCPMPSP